MRNEYLPMTEKEELSAYVRDAGGISSAARKLDIPYQTLAAVMNGNRGIGRSLASRMEKGSGGVLKASRLIWIAAEKKEAA